MKRFVALAPLALLAFLSAAPGAARAAMQETPFFEQAVADGNLPNVEDRVPAEPAVVDGTGKPGHQLRMLMSSPKDTRMMVVYGYARLVGYTPALELQPDILKSIDVEHGRIFTLHLRKGMKWSDGQPFTAEDFRYWFEDVADNRKLAPSGLPVELLTDNQPPASRCSTTRRCATAGRGRTRCFCRLLPGPTHCSSIAPPIT